MAFNNKIFLITGGSSGIGKALVEAAHAQGALVATCGRDLEKLTQAFAHLNADALYLQAVDVSQKSEVDDFVQQVLKKWGQIDVVVNNAGISMRALFDDLDITVLERVMAINFWGSVYTTKAALPAIKKSKGVIVGISSIAGYRGLPGRTGYSASKFALQGFLEALRTELLYTGVHVMWVSPGFTKSNIRNTALSSTGAAQKETPLNEDKLMSAEEVAQETLAAIAQRKRSKVMTLQGKLVVWLNKWCPAFVDKKVFDVFAKEPDSPLKKG